MTVQDPTADTGGDGDPPDPGAFAVQGLSGPASVTEGDTFAVLYAVQNGTLDTLAVGTDQGDQWTEAAVGQSSALVIAETTGQRTLTLVFTSTGGDVVNRTLPITVLPAPQSPAQIFGADLLYSGPTLGTAYDTRISAVDGLAAPAGQEPVLRRDAMLGQDALAFDVTRAKTGPRRMAGDLASPIDLDSDQFFVAVVVDYDRTVDGHILGLAPAGGSAGQGPELTVLSGGALRFGVSGQGAVFGSAAISGLEPRDDDVFGVPTIIAIEATATELRLWQWHHYVWDSPRGGSTLDGGAGAPAEGSWRLVEATARGTTTSGTTLSRLILGNRQDTTAAAAKPGRCLIADEGVHVVRGAVSQADRDELGRWLYARWTRLDEQAFPPLGSGAGNDKSVFTEAVSPAVLEHTFQFTTLERSGLYGIEAAIPIDPTPDGVTFHVRPGTHARVDGTESDALSASQDAFTGNYAGAVGDDPTQSVSLTISVGVHVALNGGETYTCTVVGEAAPSGNTVDNVVSRVTVFAPEVETGRVTSTSCSFHSDPHSARTPGGDVYRFAHASWTSDLILFRNNQPLLDPATGQPYVAFDAPPGNYAAGGPDGNTNVGGAELEKHHITGCVITCGDNVVLLGNFHGDGAIDLRVMVDPDTNGVSQVSPDGALPLGNADGAQSYAQCVYRAATDTLYVLTRGRSGFTTGGTLGDVNDCLLWIVEGLGAVTDAADLSGVTVERDVLLRGNADPVSGLEFRSYPRSLQLLADDAGRSRLVAVIAPRDTSAWRRSSVMVSGDLDAASDSWYTPDGTAGAGGPAIGRENAPRFSYAQRDAAIEASGLVLDAAYPGQILYAEPSAAADLSAWSTEGLRVAVMVARSYYDKGWQLIHPELVTYAGGVVRRSPYELPAPPHGATNRYRLNSKWVPVNAAAGTFRHVSMERGNWRHLDREGNLSPSYYTGFNGQYIAVYEVTGLWTGNPVWTEVAVYDDEVPYGVGNLSGQSGAPGVITYDIGIASGHPLHEQAGYGTLSAAQVLG
ncbi:MAG: hypothetical protein AAGG50_03740 [Bacteroidota bacterium]